MARYRLHAHRVDELLEITDRHWTTLRELEIMTDRQVEVFLGPERDTGERVVIEIVGWVNEDSSGRTHTHPTVSSVRESIGPLASPGLPAG